MVSYLYKKNVVMADGNWILSDSKPQRALEFTHHSAKQYAKSQNCINITIKVTHFATVGFSAPYGNPGINRLF